MHETSDHTVQRILRGIETGELNAQDLTARQLGAYLGRTTGHVYHHFGSLDGLLFAVAQAGFRRLSQQLAHVTEEGGGMEGLVSLSLSGRANVGAVERSDREVAISAARRLARLLFAARSERRLKGALVTRPSSKTPTSKARVRRPKPANKGG